VIQNWEQIYIYQIENWINCDIVLSNKNEQVRDIANNMDDSQKHYVKLKVWPK
jgi:hypothetical protein